jgi:beta-lysine 5,6-aminomutase beta subunit
MPDYSSVRPYGDHLNDGIVQLNFTLPVPCTSAARVAALELARHMGLDRPEISHCQQLAESYTHFIIYGYCPYSVDYAAIDAEGDSTFLTDQEIAHISAEVFKRPIVVVGASTGTDTHSVGLDAILNAKGYHGHGGLESYHAFRVHNLGSQVSNAQMVAKAIEHGADALLVSQTVTQQNLHVQNLTELVEIIEAEGIRDSLVLVCGGARITPELAKELGFDAGFSKGTYPSQVASFIVQELSRRQSHASRDAEVG